MLRVLLTLLCALVAVPALADTRIEAKLKCQAEYGSASDTDVACERGVDLHARAPENLAEALAACDRGAADAPEAGAAACRRGVSLHARASHPDRQRDKSSFAYSWQQGHGAVQLEVGNYDVLLGDAEKSMEDCMRSFEGSATPPSCLSGLRIQQQPPGRPPR